MALLSRRGFLALIGTIAAAQQLRAAAVSLDEFMELSERLLGRRGLDRKVGQTFLNAINADPDAAVTLAYLVQSNGNPTPEQRALSKAIVAMWSTANSLGWMAASLSSPWLRGW
jgi:hypothetical protein